MKVYRVVGRTGDGYESSWSWTAKTYMDKEKAEQLKLLCNTLIDKVFERSRSVKVVWQWYETEDRLKDDWKRYWKGNNYSFEDYKAYKAESNKDSIQWAFRERCFERFLKPVDPKYDFDSIGFINYDIEEIKVED